MNNLFHILSICFMPIPQSTRWSKRGVYFLQDVDFDFSET